MRRGLLNEDEALRLILQSTPVAFSPRTKSFLGFSENEIIDEAEEDNADNDNVEKSDQAHDELLLEEQIIEDESSFPYSTVGNVDSVEKQPDSPEPEEIMTISETEKMKDMRSLTVSPTLEWDNTDTETAPVVSPCLADEMREALISNTEDDNEEEHVSVSRTQSPAPACKTPSSSRCMSPTSNCSSLSLCQCPPDSPRTECRMCGTRSPGQRPTLVLQEGVVSPAPHGDLISQQHDRQRRLAGMGFIETPGVRVASLSLAQNIMMTRALDLICHESGLGSQDWRCQDCDKSIGALFGQPRLCQYTRKYYCDECHTNDMMIIPARLLYNWDATQYKVARSSQLFLKSVSNKPIINVNSFSPNLSKIAPVLDNAHRLRKQLIYLSAYLTACSKANQDGVKVSLAEIVWPREYLYNDTEMYSINDLAQLHSGNINYHICDYCIDDCRSR